MLVRSHVIAQFITLLFIVSYHLTEATIVYTDSGLLLGQINVTEGQRRPYYSFRGIPYAEPPIGRLRFEPPVPKKRWQGIKDATEEGSVCLQSSDPVIGDEDCLILNVYTPRIPAPSCNKLPVFVWIHGGSYVVGSASYDDWGPDYILEKDIVVVTVQYRLGLFGFLATGDLVVPGNNGLRDQILALKWVQKNIINFCGNPYEVTIAGQSAGGSSVSLLVESPLTTGLFQKAIYESGLSLCQFALAPRGVETTFTIAGYIGVDTTNSSTLVAGLRQVDAADIQTVADSLLIPLQLGYIFGHGSPIGPISEPPHRDAVFSGSSYVALSKGRLARIPILLGFNSLEGNNPLLPLLLGYLATYDADPSRLLPNAINVNASQAVEAGTKIKEAYWGSEPVASLGYPTYWFTGDDQWERPIRQYVRLVRNTVPVYLYRFSYNGGLAGNYNRTVQGVLHTEEGFYLFRSPYAPESPHDLVVRSRLVTLWTNFIKYANPTPNYNPNLQYVIWPRTDSQLTYLDIGVNLALARNPDKERLAIWDYIYATYGNPPYTTY